MHATTSTLPDRRPAAPLPADRFVRFACQHDDGDVRARPQRDLVMASLLRCRYATGREHGRS
jgi:hypothetical protein